MGSMSAEQVNEQAAMVASQVLNDSVIAAARCEQVTQGQQLKAAGVGTATRGMANVGTKMGQLRAGKILKSWDREGFTASLGNDAINAVSGAPEDRQILPLSLPLDGS